ncbi:MAG: hypothetical protein WC919_01785 [Candidatus Paceibacterota bacterium]
MDKLYTVHRYFNQVCSDAGIRAELLVSEDDVRVALVKRPLTKITEGLRKAAVASGIIAETRIMPSGTMVIMTSNPSLSVSSIASAAEYKFGKFYRDLNEAFDKPWEKKDEKEEDKDKPDEKKKDWKPDEDEPPRAKDRFFEDREAMLAKSIDEALDGIAVPDGAAQPGVGVKMLNKALAAKTRSGMTLKDALKKQGIVWHVAEPGSHVVVFKGKNGDEKWRVEPMTLSDTKVFEKTMEALWSVALGKAPNAKELELDAAKQRAKELGDHQKEISGLVDQITGKYAPQPVAGDKNAAVNPR